MKSVVNGATTYFVGKLYQKRIEGGNTIEEKTYFNGERHALLAGGGPLTLYAALQGCFAGIYQPDFQCRWDVE